MSKTERLVVDIDAELKQEFKEYASAIGTNMKHVISQFIKETLKSEAIIKNTRPDATNTTFRVPDDCKKILGDLHGSAGAGAVKAIQAYVQLRPGVLARVSSRFKASEIKALAQALKKGAYDPAYMSSKEVLASKLSLELDGPDSSIDQSALAVLVEAVKTISPPECYFLQEEIFRRIEKK